MAKVNRKFGPTQKDIAEALNLSQATVAFALNSKHQHKLLPDTVALVQAKAKEMNYHPQPFARNLRNGRSHTVGVVFRSGLYHAPQERVKFLARSALGMGYQLVAVDLDWFVHDERAAQEYLLSYAPEGVILCNISQEMQVEWALFFQQRSLPVVSLSSSLTGLMDRVLADTADAFRKLTIHHLEQGSRRLALLLAFRDRGYLGWPGESIMQRATGFKEAILKAGGVVETDEAAREALELPAPSRRKNPEIVGEILYPVKTDEFSNAFELGQYQVNRMIREGSLPDSLICTNDEIAAGAMAACLRNGIEIPGRVRISGADDAPFSRFYSVPITSVRQPSQEMAQWAIERIIELIEVAEERTRPQQRLFPCEIVIRESTTASMLPSSSPEQPQILTPL